MAPHLLNGLSLLLPLPPPHFSSPGQPPYTMSLAPRSFLKNRLLTKNLGALLGNLPPGAVEEQHGRSERAVLSSSLRHIFGPLESILNSPHRKIPKHDPSNGAPERASLWRTLSSILNSVNINSVGISWSTTVLRRKQPLTQLFLHHPTSPSVSCPSKRCSHCPRPGWEGEFCLN